jgi:hypothetical protein
MIGDRRLAATSASTTRPSQRLKFLPAAPTGAQIGDRAEIPDLPRALESARKGKKMASASRPGNLE